MSGATSFLRDLDLAVSRGTAESRTRALWHTTDLMITGRYSDDEIWTFGEVIGRLADEIEVAARAQLARRLARFDNAPVNIIHKLAFDNSIDVAGPILQESTGSSRTPWSPTSAPRPRRTCSRSRSGGRWRKRSPTCW